MPSGPSPTMAGTTRAGSIVTSMAAAKRSFLGAEVVVDQRRVHAGGLRDAAHGRLVVPALREHLAGGAPGSAPGCRGRSSASSWRGRPGPRRGLTGSVTAGGS